MNLKRYIHPLFFLCPLICLGQTEGSPEEDSLILRIIYDSLGGPGWYNTWDLEKPFNTWFGVVTDENNRVTMLDLADGDPLGETSSDQGNNLTGNLPYQICFLTELRFLNLSLSNITGNIPPKLGSLPKLEYLYLFGNQISGPIPEELGQLGTLKEILLHSNNLSGEIPGILGEIEGLEILNLQNNKFTGGIPTQISQLSNLVELSLRSNNLSGEIPAGLGELLNLTNLNLKENDLTGSIPTELSMLVNLNRLFLGNNELSGEIPPELGNMSELVWLDLSENDLEGMIPAAFKDLNSLRSLLLNNNRLSGEIPAGIGFMSNLWFFDARYNELEGSIPGEIGNLGALTYCYLSHNKLAGEIPDQIGNLGSLSTLDLASNMLAGTIPESIGNLLLLKTLLLGNNDLGGGIPDALVNLSRLVQIDLGRNNLTGNIPTQIGSLFRLQILNLEHNRLGGEIPASIYGLRKIEELKMAFNNLSGGLSEDVGTLLNIKVLDVSSNLLEGVLPSSLGDLQNAEQIILSNNNFEGHLPEGVSEIENLFHFNVGNNNLSGCLPESYESLCSIEDRLSGTYGDRDSFNVVNFSGNVDLLFHGDFSEYCLSGFSSCSNCIDVVSMLVDSQYLLVLMEYSLDSQEVTTEVDGASADRTEVANDSILIFLKETLDSGAHQLQIFIDEHCEIVLPFTYPLNTDCALGSTTDIFAIIDTTSLDHERIVFSCYSGWVDLKLTIGSEYQLAVFYEMDYFADGTIDSISVGENASGVHPVGTHAMVWHFTDLCGDTAMFSHRFRVLPEPPHITSETTHDIYLVESDDPAEPAIAVINAADLIRSSFSCAGVEGMDFRIEYWDTLGTLPTTSGLVIGCDQVFREILVNLWAVDDFGGRDYVTIRLKVHDEDGLCHNLVDLKNPTNGTMLEESEAFYLSQNWPNPFSEGTAILVAVPYNTAGTFEILDVSGKKMYSRQMDLNRGLNEIHLSRKQFSAPGTYFYRITTPIFSQTRRMFFGE